MNKNKIYILSIIFVTIAYNNSSLSMNYPWNEDELGYHNNSSDLSYVGLDCFNLDFEPAGPTTFEGDLEDHLNEMKCYGQKWKQIKRQKILEQKRRQTHQAQINRNRNNRSLNIPTQETNKTKKQAFYNLIFTLPPCGPTIFSLKYVLKFVKMRKI